MITREDSVNLYNFISEALTAFFDNGGEASLDDIFDVTEKVHEHLHDSGVITIPALDEQ